MDRCRGARRTRCALALLGAVVLVLAFAPSALARTFTVTRSDDAVPSSCQRNDCSLREAIAAADAHRGADTVEFGNALSGDTIVLARGALQLRRELTIAGPGAQKLAVSGNQLSRIFHVVGGRITISGITIKNGHEDATPTGPKCPNSSASFYMFGGGILQDAGNLKLERVKVSNNSVERSPPGGAIVGGGGIGIIDGKLRLTRSRLAGNTADGGAISEGGGIVNCIGAVTLNRTAVANNAVSATAISDGGGILSGNGTGNPGELTVIRSTVRGNNSTAGSIGDGGGISVVGGPLTMMASTISANTATVSGGGTLADGGGLYIISSPAVVTNSTIVENFAIAQGAAGGGILLGGGTTPSLRLQSSTLARNTADGTNSAVGGNLAGSKFARLLNTIVAKGKGDAAVANCDDDVRFSGHSLEDRNTCGFDGEGDRVNKNPLLRDLSNNGGPTDTMALKPGSPAVDHAGRRSSPKLDQRGFVRGRNPDIGAFELGATH
jgi:CSLREA domain-containing protein